jgi:NAD+ synthase
MEKIAEHIQSWLKKYALNSGQSGFVIGVSGGIDSAVVSTLCAKTGLKTIVVSLPIREKIGQSLSLEHCDYLCQNYQNVSKVEIDLSDTFTEFEKAFKKSQPVNNNFELTMANSRSRLRMTVLYSIASNHNLLVTGTGNKIEDFAIGFYTKWGDGGVDISPIADLMKSEVYQLGKFLKVPESILNVKPTDGLWQDGRTDEDQIGATYDELEWAMNYLKTGVIDYLKAPDIDRQSEVLKIYTKRHNANRHKMNPIPVCSLEKFRNYRDELEINELI